MHYSTRIKRKKNGDTQIRITIDVTADEIEGVGKIADDKHCTIDMIRQHDHELSLAYARIFCFWVDMWNNASKEVLTQCAVVRKAAENKWSQRKEKRRARKNRKK